MTEDTDESFSSRVEGRAHAYISTLPAVQFVVMNNGDAIDLPLSDPLVGWAEALAVRDGLIVEVGGNPVKRLQDLIDLTRTLTSGATEPMPVLERLRKERRLMRNASGFMALVAGDGFVDVEEGSETTSGDPLGFHLGTQSVATLRLDLDPCIETGVGAGL